MRPAALCEHLLTADRNQTFNRMRMSAEKRAATAEVDFRPFIIADADTGHGGDAHVRNLIRRFVEVGVPGYHIEDQRPGSKKCGHQGGKVLVAEDEQIKRLNAARFQLDVMGVPGIIVARTDAESATLLESCCDERDQPFILGATNIDLPTYKVAYLTILRKLQAAGIAEIKGHMLYSISDEEYADAFVWLDRAGYFSLGGGCRGHLRRDPSVNLDALLDKVSTRFADAWQAEAGLKTYARAVADVMEFRRNEGEEFPMTVDQWIAFARHASFVRRQDKGQIHGSAHHLGLRTGANRRRVLPGARRH